MKEGKCTVLYHCISQDVKMLYCQMEGMWQWVMAYSVMLFQKFSDESTRNHANLSQDS